MKKKYAVYFSIFVFLVLAFCVMPVSGDDFFRVNVGKNLHSIGDLISIVREKYLTGNPRVFGNILAYSVGGRRMLSSVVRGLFTLLLLVIFSLVTGKKSAFDIALAFCFLFFLPREMFIQIYPWEAGFYNYLPPVALMLLAVVLMRKRGGIIPFLLLPLGFVSAFFIEHTTIALVFLSVAFIVFDIVKAEKASLNSALYFLGTSLGGFVLFSSPAYGRMRVSGGAYEMPDSAYDMIKRALSSLDDILEIMTVNSPILVISLAVTVGFLYFGSEKKLFHKVLFALTSVLASALVVDSFVPFDKVYLPISFLILIFLSLVIFKFENKALAIILFLTSLMSSAPLLAVNPIGPRCLFNFYVLMFAVVFSVTELNFKWLTPVSLFLALIVMAHTFAVYIPLNKVYREEIRIIENAIEKGEDEVMIPRIGDYENLWDADSDKITFAYYYKTPGDLKITYKDN